MVTNDNVSESTSKEQMKFTDRMRRATRKEHRLSDALINAKLTIGKSSLFL